MVTMLVKCFQYRSIVMGLAARRRRAERVAFAIAALVFFQMSPHAICAWADEPPADASSESQPPRFTYRVTGLFCPERIKDFRRAVAELPGLELVSLDGDRAIAIFAFDPNKLFDHLKPHDYTERLSNRLKNVSMHTFGVLDLLPTEPEKLERVEIAIISLDCKACGLGVYETIYKLDGLDHATVDYKAGKVVAWIDPRKIDRAAVEAALVKGQVRLATPPEKSGESK